MIQSLLIISGGAYERLVLSDYGERPNGNGRSFLFWMGDTLPEALFKKNITSLSKLIRRTRNLLCTMSLLTVLVFDPILHLCGLGATAKLVLQCLTKLQIVSICIVYTLCQMYEETK